MRGESLLEVRLPAVGQGRNTEGTFHDRNVVVAERFLNVQAGDVFDPHAVRIASEYCNRVASRQVALPSNADIEAGTAAREKASHHRVRLKSDPELVAGQTRLRDDQVSGADREL